MLLSLLFLLVITCASNAHQTERWVDEDVKDRRMIELAWKGAKELNRLCDCQNYKVLHKVIKAQGDLQSHELDVLFVESTCSTQVFSQRLAKLSSSVLKYM